MGFLLAAWQVMDEYKRRKTVVRDLEAEVAGLESETQRLRNNALKIEKSLLGVQELQEKGTDE